MTSSHLLPYHLVGVLWVRVLATALPQWAVVGDNYPLGCAFDKAIVFHEYFEACPDTNDSRYNTKVNLTCCFMRIVDLNSFVPGRISFSILSGSADFMDSLESIQKVAV